MTTYQPDDRARMRRQRTDRAIKLAMESKWEEAAQENQAIIALFPRDVDAHNRLGKAMTELGRYADGRTAYKRALELDANNTIARKNLQRLEALGEVAVAPAEGRQKVDPDLFIEETGKTGITLLQHPSRDVLQHMTAGDRIDLKRQGNGLLVATPAGEFLGMVEPKLAVRLTRLMDTGNEYAAAIASVSPAGDQGRIIIKEIRQSSENAGRLSFPATGPEGVRPYTKDAWLRDALDDEDADTDEAEGEAEWEDSAETEGTTEVSFDFEKARETEADHDDEYEN